MNTNRRVVYASQTSGIHDARWLSALSELGFNPIHAARDQSGSAEDFIARVAFLSKNGDPILSGPLEVATLLVGLAHPVILLSWGFDLQEASDNLDLTNFAAVIVDSRANETLAQNCGAGEVLRMPWGIRLDAFSDFGPVMDLSDFGVESGSPVVLSLRAHEERYHVDDIIRAFAKTEGHARLVIGNAGSLTKALQNLARHVDVDAVFVPPVDESDLPALLRRASVYATASDVDGTSVTLLQAMACGVPVVASTNAGNVDWVKDLETGFTFPVGDVNRLSQALDTALTCTPGVTAAARKKVLENANWNQNIHRLKPLLMRQR